MLTILMIDDEEDLVSTVQNHIEAELQDVRFEKEHNWKNALVRLESVRPDLVILDWFRGVAGTGDVAGKKVLEEIWKKWFCPVVVYSAGSVDLGEEALSDHPFVKTVEKGNKSLLKVSGHLRDFSSHVNTLKEVANDIDRVKHEVLRDLAAAVYTSLATEEKRLGVLKRATRRRIAAIMDDPQHLGDDSAQPWEQYIFPVLTNHPIMGDVIRLSNQPVTNPTAHRVILTPTCDMVSHGGKPCKAPLFLAAKCDDPKKLLSHGLGLQVGTKAKKSDVKSSLKKALNDAHTSGLVVLPECAGRIPLMIVDLRDLELIPATDVATGTEMNKKYQRVASIDSPFRENIAWGYLQIGCRPGVPPRDCQELAATLADLWDYGAEAKK
jgi:CheY-like chemotaxis protein